MEKYEEITDPAMRVIGKGSYGEVRLIKEIATGNFYAMKVINKRTVSNEGCLEAMLREI